MTFKVRHSRLFALVLATIFALPFSLGWLTGLFIWTSPLVFLNSLSSQSLSWLSIIGAIILIFVTLRHRWYCRWLCPTGLLCDSVSKLSRLRVLKGMPPLGIFLAALVFGAAIFDVPALGLLDPIVAFHAFFSGFKVSLVPALLSMAGLIFIVGINFISRHVWCNKLCPLGGLQDGLTSLRKMMTKKDERATAFDVGRRAAIGALGGFGFAVLFKRSIATSASIIRPPAALPEGQFQSTCIRCGNCARACPTHIIQSSFDANDIAGLLTPKISFTHGYCLPACTACGTVCPSGAIKTFSKNDKKSLVLGIAHIDVENCLLSRHKECDRCQFYCDYDAVMIHPSDFELAAWPEINRQRCVGCGACAVVCPANAIRIEAAPQI
ncbi:4Fe-4S dicluster domain-containing protein [candidate division KSB1 bacterium]|nr:4Fe-4S dicluster domain-containing protein [candidate division KSB1 bacterium]